MKPLIHSGNSANIDFYRERDAKPRDPYVWAEVLRNEFERGPDGKIRARRLPVYHVTVYRVGTGFIGETTYEPKQRPPSAVLSPRTIGQLVRRVVGA